MAYPPPANRAPPRQHSQGRPPGPPRPRHGPGQGPPGPMPHSNGYDQDWQQGDYYESVNGYDGYNQGPDRGGYSQGPDRGYHQGPDRGGYDQGHAHHGQGNGWHDGYNDDYYQRDQHDQYGSRERPPPNPNWRGPPRGYSNGPRRGPPPQMHGPPQGYPPQGPPSGPPGHPRDPYNRGPPRSRGPPPPQHFDEHNGWNQQSAYPRTSQSSRQSFDQPRPEHMDSRPSGDYDRREFNGPDRGHMPDFRPAKHQPNRPGTATGVRGPAPRVALPAQSQTSPSTPLDSNFPRHGEARNGPPGAGLNFSLPSRGKDGEPNGLAGRPEDKPFAGRANPMSPGPRQPDNRGPADFAPPSRNSDNRPGTPSKPNVGGVDRPNFYPGMGAPPNAAPVRSQPSPIRKTSEPALRRSVESGRPAEDALPYHPVPVRPGLQPGNSNSSAGSKPPEKKPPPATRRVSMPVTHAELDSLRNGVARNPNDPKMQFTLARKLIEAARVLADEGGRVDQKTKMMNQERYVNEALKLIKRLVAAEYTDAMFFMADSFGEGLLGLPHDPKEAFTLYQGAAKLGHAAAAYRTAVCCEIGAEEGGGTRRDPVKAVQWYKRAASLGDLPATYKCGIIYLRGLLGQEKSMLDAVNYLKKAADMADEENPHAVHELALLYESSTEMRRDEGAALQLFNQAGRLGYKFSQFRLGQVYEYGQLGCPSDARNSIIWYTKAAAQGEHQAELALSGWYLTGADGILEHNDVEAYLWARKAATAEPPLPKACFAMGYYTEVGIGCPRSLEEAKRWYSRAAGRSTRDVANLALNFPKARQRLEELRRGGVDVQKNREQLSRGGGGQAQKQQEDSCTVM